MVKKATKTEQKYLEALKDLHQILQTKSNLKMGDFSKTHKVNNILTSVLCKGGIIRNEGSKIHPSWHWNTIYPNIFMARKTLDEINGIYRKSSRKQVEVVVEEPKQHKVDKVKRVYDKTQMTAVYDTTPIPTKPKTQRGKYNIKPKKGTVKMYQVRLLFGLIKIKIYPTYN